MYKILLTCPPMIKQLANYTELLEKYKIKIEVPEFTQVMKEEELIKILPQYDAWIIGDDPATRAVFEAGKKGNLKAVVKWGVGVDNVDFEACKDLDLPVTNTPAMFGEEVSDVAIGYLVCLARQIHVIDKETKSGNWHKPCGISLKGKKVCLVGFGDIGRCTAKKLLAFDMEIYVSDPGFGTVITPYGCEIIVCKYNTSNDDSISVFIPKELQDANNVNLHLCDLDSALENADFIITTCALNNATHHLINEEKIRRAKRGVRIINVSRGQVVDNESVCRLLEEGFIHSVGFDVFEEEPLLKTNELTKYPGCILGSHNGSNTIEAVNRTSVKVIELLNKYLVDSCNNS